MVGCPLLIDYLGVYIGSGCWLSEEGIVEYTNVHFVVSYLLIIT